jgi:hypothetical protein
MAPSPDRYPVFLERCPSPASLSAVAAYSRNSMLPAKFHKAQTARFKFDGKSLNFLSTSPLPHLNFLLVAHLSIHENYELPLCV